jgi:hypothetical protein
MIGVDGFTPAAGEVESASLWCAVTYERRRQQGSTPTMATVMTSSISVKPPRGAATDLARPWLRAAEAVPLPVPDWVPPAVRLVLRLHRRLRRDGSAGAPLQDRARHHGRQVSHGTQLQRLVDAALSVPPKNSPSASSGRSMLRMMRG